MISPRFPIGTQLANDQPEVSGSFTPPATPPSTLRELLDIIAAHGDKNLAMLRTTSVRLSDFLGKSVDDLSIEVLVDVRSGFSEYLKQRRYAPNSIRTYRRNTQSMLRWAERLGWVSNKKSVEVLWEPFLVALAGDPRPYSTIIFHAIQNGRSPSEFSAQDIDDWGNAMLKAGRQYRTVRQGKSHFRRALASAGLDCKLPKLKAAPRKTVYRVPTTELPEPLQSQLAELLVWKQARFAKGRPQWTRHRAVSAKLMERTVCQLFGYARDIAGFTDVGSLPTLFREDVISSFIEWGVNVRGLARGTLLRMTMVGSSMRFHPKYKSIDLGWFRTIFDGVPEDDKSAVQERKARKSVPFEDLCKIPGAIRAARLQLKQDDPKVARLVHDELLILWMTTFPWRQRNIRECRIGEPSVSNLFFAPLPQLTHIARPTWVEEALAKNPGQSFWQFYFREEEIKTGQTARGILPRRLLPLLEDYLANHRPNLVRGKNTATLFVNADGEEISDQILTYHVSEIVLKHTGCRMTPHLFRDAFAYAYLSAHPEDFLTLSKCLFHLNVKSTLDVYGRNFDESNGVRRIDEWLGAAA